MHQLIQRASLALLVMSAVPGIAAQEAAPTEPRAFVSAATQAGLLEIAAGRVAMNASTNPVIKDFADRMITDHQKAGAELAAIARQKSFTVPTELDEQRAQLLKSLREKSTQDFDAAYAAQMSRHHAQAVALFQANTASPDSELAAFATKTLPVLKQHKRLADRLDTDMKAR